MKYVGCFVVAASAVAVLGACATQEVPPPSGSAVVSSSPGRATASSTVDMTAQVVMVEKLTRTVTLRGPQGKTMDVVAGDEVRNFDQIRIGDWVVVRYREALTLELRKSKGAVGAAGAGVAARAAPGERPAGIVGREVQITAEVVEVDPVRSIIALKGPKGNVVELKVSNRDHFKVVKKGDLVDATYQEAVAIAVQPTTPGAGK